MEPEINTAADAAPPRAFWLAMGFVCLELAGMAGQQVSVGNWLIAVLPALAIAGIVRRVRWGRRLAVGMQVLLLIMGFGAVMPPERGMPLSREMPPIEAAVIEAAVLAGLALLCLHLLGLWKKSFRAAWI